MAIDDDVLEKCAAQPAVFLGAFGYEPGSPLQRLGDVLLWVGLSFALPFAVRPPRREPGGCAGFWVPAICKTRAFADEIAARWNDVLGPTWKRDGDLWSVIDVREVAA